MLLLVLDSLPPGQAVTRVKGAAGLSNSKHGKFEFRNKFKSPKAGNDPIRKLSTADYADGTDGGIGFFFVGNSPGGFNGWEHCSQCRESRQGRQNSPSVLPDPTLVLVIVLVIDSLPPSLEAARMTARQSLIDFSRELVSPCGCVARSLMESRASHPKNRPCRALRLYQLDAERSSATRSCPL